jgi:hypothetical protein
MTIFREDGFLGFISILISKSGLPIPQTARFKWKAGILRETKYWDAYFRTKGLEYADIYSMRFDPDLPLQPRLTVLLPPHKEIHILDVGAGPLTYIGKKCEGKHIKITAVDPLADQYDRILDKYKIQPLVRTETLVAESRGKIFLKYLRPCGCKELHRPHLRP